MAKLLLISLRDPFLDNDRVMPPMGVMALNSFILGHGYASHIENDFDLENIRKYEDYTHFGISCMTPEKEQAYAVLRAIKERFPQKTVVIGGPHAQHYLDECIARPFDHIVRGDGEHALLEIIRGKAGQQRILNLPVTEEEMNEMPLPYREPAFLNQYSFHFQGVRATTILTAKGCPMACKFCEDARSNVKLYTPENIGGQIADAKKAGYQGVMFFDDIFSLSMKRVHALASEISKHGIYYRCFGHAKSMTEEMAKVLSDSGCLETGFGAESGSQRILDISGKKTTVKQNRLFIETCNKFGIKVKAFIILGLPSEDRETVSETVEFLKFLIGNRFRNKFGKEITNDFDLTIYFPYKGTQIRDSMDRNENKYDLILTQNPDTMSGFYKGKGGKAEVAVRTSKLSGGELEEIQRSLLAEFKPRVIA
ncbi:MAG: B12-binding domain-containing radical SAM protein [Nitrospinae bacterium]|nr:B12-binding domain-containing radical SAM protein [Nitrospinota bacterium]